MSLGNSSWKEARLTIQSVFSKGSAKQEEAERCLVPVSKAIMHMPAEIGDYTDFYASMEHASNVGALFRGRENALMPNW